MKTVKTAFAIVLCVCFAFVVTACGADKKKTESKPQSVVSEISGENKNTENPSENESKQPNFDSNTVIGEPSDNNGADGNSSEKRTDNSKTAETDSSDKPEEKKDEGSADTEKKSPDIILPDIDI